MNTISNSVASYCSKINAKFRDFSSDNPNVRFDPPPLESSIIQERIMRMGIECRCTSANMDDDLYVLALATLKQDIMNGHGINNPFEVTTQFEQLFSMQPPGVLYYMHCNLDSGYLPQIYRAESIDWIRKNFSSGAKSVGAIPYLYK